MKVLLIWALLPVLLYARIEEGDMPAELSDCYSRSPYSIDGQNTCLGEYLSQTYRNSSALHISAVQWLDSLGRKLHLRLKRQVARNLLRGRGGLRGGLRRLVNTRLVTGRTNRRLRVRKEIRTLSANELDDFFEAVNALKNDKSVKPNKYDAFSLAHQGTSIPSAHDGPNFVSWHRYLLVLFEDALRTKRRGVTLPYWDSTLDYRMTKPEDTVLFSEVLVGNGDGVVYNGPFALWETPSDNTLLRRSIPGTDSSLIDPERLKSVFTKRYHREILVPTAVEIDDNLEFHHDAVHRWVGVPNGHMADVNLAAMDPLFFLHHCFIDYLWEQFRERQKKLGINSETDYPKTDLALHAPDRLMDNLTPPKKNIEGYSNQFTSTIYRYADAPTCANGCGGGRSAFLYCDRQKNGCVSRSRQEFERQNGFNQVKYVYGSGMSGKQENTGYDEAVAVAPSPQVSPNPSLPTALLPQRSASLSTRQAPKITRYFKTNIVDRRTRNRGKRSVDFMNEANRIHVELDINVSLKQNGEYTIIGGSPITAEDLAVTPIIINSVSHGSEVSGDNSSLSTLNNNNDYFITFETIGLSYLGHSVDSLRFDSRTRQSESVVAISFKKPELESRDVYVRVTDSNGAICQATCLVNGYDYRECTGVLKITPDTPLMYTDNSTNNNDQTLIPYLKFFCI